MPASTASVARCTSIGLASMLSRCRETARVSSSSRRTMAMPSMAIDGIAIVLLDELETLAVSRHRLSMDANPIDVHRATDAVLAGMDRLTRQHRNVLLIGTTNFPK